MPRKRIAVCSACFSLGVSILIGLKVDNPTEVILTRALAAMAIFYLLGGVVAMIAESVAAEHLRERQEEQQRLSEAEQSQSSDGENDRDESDGDGESGMETSETSNLETPESALQS
jgi:uncharacterized membrane protein YcjF (UPF0283 family)